MKKLIDCFFLFSYNSMERQKILNPLTGRMVYADGVVAKSIPKMKKSVGVLEGAVKRTGTTKIAEKKEAVGKLSGAIKRTLAKKPEPAPPPQPRRVYGWEDLPDDVKDKISGIVKGDTTFEEDKKKESLDAFSFRGWSSNIIKRLKPDINSKKDIDYVKKASRGGFNGAIVVKTYTRKERVEKLSDLSNEVLNKKGGMKHYPLLCFTIDFRGYEYLDEDHYIKNPPKELWIRGRDAETCFKDGREYAGGIPYFLFPDGDLFTTDLNVNFIFGGILNSKKNLFENNNLKIDWRKVPESDQRIGRFDKVKSKYLPNFALPKN